jgi:hypothetical protein
MEQALLALALAAQARGKELAAAIAKRLELFVKSAAPDTNQRKKLFDTVISAKAKSGGAERLKKMEKELAQKQLRKASGEANDLYKTLERGEQLDFLSSSVSSLQV